MAMLAKALGVSTDQMLGIEKVETSRRKKDNRLWRRFSLIENMEGKEKRRILQLLDTFIEKDQLKRRTGT